MRTWFRQRLAAILVLGTLGLACVVLSTCGALPAQAFDSGQYGDVAPNVRAWFKAVKSPSGVPCCDIADGHRTTWRAGKAGGYEVPIRVVGFDGKVKFDNWVAVPPEAVIYGAGNPTGEAVVWYGFYSGKPWIRCFVPGGGV